jgi:hypothetical protein
MCSENDSSKIFPILFLARAIVVLYPKLNFNSLFLLPSRNQTPLHRQPAVSGVEQKEQINVSNILGREHGLGLQPIVWSMPKSVRHNG